MSDILIVDDDSNILPVLTDVFNRKDFAVRTCSSLHQAQHELSQKIPDGLLVDLVLPDGSGLELVERLKCESTQIIIMTGYPTLDSAIAGVRSNAVDYLVKPIELDRLRSWLDKLKTLQIPATDLDNTEVRFDEADTHHAGIVGKSAATKKVTQLIAKVAPSDVTVLLQGESGTGKEVAARAIHQASLRKDKPLLCLNCGAANENLISDELFGHERGGFTGANKQHKGFFERAHGGTLFLDEITEMPIELQAHLLRVLETGKFVRIGGDTEITTDVRLIAATNRDPFKAIAEGKLREDLYYRLAIFPIQLPPLRERLDDIELLARFFIDDLNKEKGCQKSISDDALDYLKSLSWPGNIRQLKNVIQRAHLLAGQRIEASHCNAFPHETPVDPANNGNGTDTLSDKPIDQVERCLIFDALEEYEGNKKLVASKLGISLKTLYNKLNKYKKEDSNADGSRDYF